MQTSKIAVQSYCFRNFKDNAQVAQMAAECGFAQIELCGVHADFQDENAFDSVIESYRAQGVEIVSIGVEGFADNAPREARLFEFTRRCGARLISADFAIDTVPGCYRTAEKLAAELSTRIAIHNHGGPHWLGSATALRNVFKNTDKSIGLCLDTAWALDARLDPVDMAREFADRLYAVHIKDFVFNRAGKPEDVIAGEGNLDVSALVEVLHETNFDGPLIVEYEGDVENPVPALKKCSTALKAALLK